MQAKIVAGLLGVMVLAACGAPATVAPTPLNPTMSQASSMQSYGPGAVTTDPTGAQSYTDAAPTVATGEEPAPEESAAPEPTPEATPTPAPTAEPTEEPSIPIMDDSDDEPAPKQTLWQKVKTGASNVVNKAICLFKKDC